MEGAHTVYGRFFRIFQIYLNMYLWQLKITFKMGILKIDYIEQ